MTRPLITTDPAVHHGQPMIGPAPVDAVCSRIWAGETVVDVADDYGISVAQVLTACWFEATHNPRGWRLMWRNWAAIARPLLARGHYDAIPDPPTKELSNR